jgi:hypothetical protein
MAVPPVSIDDFALATVASRPDEAGGPHLKFYELRDNLLLVCVAIEGDEGVDRITVRVAFIVGLGCHVQSRDSERGRESHRCPR